MTSRSLFFRLMKEDMKRRIWAVGLSFLTFFFWMPVAGAMGISNLMQNYARWQANGATFSGGTTLEMELRRRMLDLVSECIGFENVMAAFSVGTLALVLALTGFMFLHSKKQMDFYHSVPVRREVLFAVKYLNGFLIVLTAYFINLLFAIGIFAANGIGLSLLIPAGFTAMFIHMAGFLLIYGLMTIAVVLTGNFFISILGGIVLFSYVPAVTALAEGLMYMFFVTVNTRDSGFETFMIHGSPISYYASLMSDGASLALEKYGTLLERGTFAVVTAVLFAAVALLLYRLRPSESAGKAMAFQVSMAPIKVLLVVPMTIFASLMLWNIYYSLPWAAFGFLLGLALSHGIIEIIYHFEFRKLFSNPVHMGICAVLSLAVIGVFRYDLTGYERYLPSEKDFESASVYAGSLIDWQGNYGLPQKYEEEDGGGYHWKYLNGEDYAAGNMRVSDYGLIRELAEAGIINAQKSREAKLKDHWAAGEREENGEYRTSLEVGYHLKNGKTVYRNYDVCVTALRDTFDRMYESDEYKKGIYPVLSYTMDNINGIYEAKDSRIRRVDTDKAMQQKILETYQEELLSLTLEERSEETPVTSLRFLTLAEYDYLKYTTAARSPGFAGDFRLEDMSQVNFFPVYPSFTGTIRLLNETGLCIPQVIPAEDVERIEISSYYGTEYWDDGAEEDVVTAYAQTVSVRDGMKLVTIENDGTKENEEKIREILKASEIQDMMELNGLQPVEHGLTVSIFRKSVNEGKSPAEEECSLYTFRPDSIPEFVRTAIGYDAVKNRNVSYGLNGNKKQQ